MIVVHHRATADKDRHGISVQVSTNAAKHGIARLRRGLFFSPSSLARNSATGSGKNSHGVTVSKAGLLQADLARRFAAVYLSS
jgi:hypothetical protein